MTTPDDELPHRWVRARQDILIALWASFLAASVAMLAFFALFDPSALITTHVVFRGFEDRLTGYSVGFLFFWAICSAGSILTAWLIDTRRPFWRES